MSYLTRQMGKDVPQSEALPGQVNNSAGGHSWAVDDWTRLDRFLILGSEGGSYYASERKLTLANVGAVERCIAADGPRAVRRIVEISDAGRAPKNGPALLALALAMKKGDDATKDLARSLVSKVARTGTHVLELASHIEALKGWGRGNRRAIANWFDGQPADKLAYQAVKYQQRDGWALRDLLKLSHPKGKTKAHESLYRWIAGAREQTVSSFPEELALVEAMEAIKLVESTKDAIAIIKASGLPREAIPTEHLAKAEVWEALLPEMPMGTLVRNLATMTKNGLVANGSNAAREVCSRLGDVEAIRKARLHPIALLSAQLTYAAGHGMRGKSTWTPVQPVVDALDSAFYASFAAVEPSGKRILLALDVSGSMDGGEVAGVPGLTPRRAAAAMALVTAATEKDWAMVGFSNTLVDVPISPRMRLDQAAHVMARIPMGGTDCSLPMLWARQRNREFDLFSVYTDSETWAGNVHPSKALAAYRDQMKIPAKLVVVGMVANEFTIADPNDGGMLDVVGFDSAAPAVIADFARGAL